MSNSDFCNENFTVYRWPNNFLSLFFNLRKGLFWIICKGTVHHSEEVKVAGVGSNWSYDIHHQEEDSNDEWLMFTLGSLLKIFI